MITQNDFYKSPKHFREFYHTMNIKSVINSNGFRISKKEVNTVITVQSVTVLMYVPDFRSISRLTLYGATILCVFCP